MLLKAKYKYNIDMKKSIFIGDKLTDMIAGEKANIGKLIYFNKNKARNTLQLIIIMKSRNLFKQCCFFNVDAAATR